MFISLRITTRGDQTRYRARRQEGHRLGPLRCSDPGPLETARQIDEALSDKGIYIRGLSKKGNALNFFPQTGNTDTNMQ